MVQALTRRHVADNSDCLEVSMKIEYDFASGSPPPVRASLSGSPKAAKAASEISLTFRNVATPKVRAHRSTVSSEFRQQLQAYA